MNPDFKDFVSNHLNDNLNQLILKNNDDLSFDIKDAIVQIECKKKAEFKLPTWFSNNQIEYFSKLAMEQCSSEVAALYKANLCSGSLLIDTTGGFGVDSFAFSQRVEKIIYIERNKDLADLVQQNFNILGIKNVVFKSMDSVLYLEMLENEVDWIYLDPARRDGDNRKTVRFDDCEPNLIVLLPSLMRKAQNIMVKTSPLIDLQYALTCLSPFVDQIHIISIGGECKEVLFVLNQTGSSIVKIKTINILKNNNQVFESVFGVEKKVELNYALPLSYLYEPNSAIMKAGLFRTVAERFGLFKLHVNTHLYTSDILIENFPGRVFKCDEILKADKKIIAPYTLKKQANLTIRNFPSTVDDLKRKLDLKDGGTAYFFACTLMDDRKVILVCSKILNN